jgi:hypothetical protein
MYSSPIVLISRESYPYEDYINEAAYLFYPTTVFTNCSFTDNKGNGAGAVEIKG